MKAALPPARCQAMTASVYQKLLRVVRSIDWSVCSPAPEARPPITLQHQVSHMTSPLTWTPDPLTRLMLIPLRASAAGNVLSFSHSHSLSVMTGCSLFRKPCNSIVLAGCCCSNSLAQRGQRGGQRWRGCQEHVGRWLTLCVCVALIYSDSLQSTVSKWLRMTWSSLACACTHKQKKPHTLPAGFLSIVNKVFILLLMENDNAIGLLM